ncbi:alanine--tRNA ligase [Desulfovibrio inopinatus]|uniref:alanine--tRNA ligase n=1 Tax=Desulfovibrio inopinatus TaxID=102109 RepID=UPI0003FE1C10|nr:alanine--tRNA ligase [Desulfovibrio inopinatus]
MKASEIRQRFLKFFAQNDHEVVSSSSLVPKDDPSLLFTNAGMVQFKKVFLGQEKRPYSRATTAQKCLRVGGKHNDLENVGRTARHHTFFEMLGNFSFGDYFKEDAIRLAWDFLTKEVGLPKDRLYITVYKDDTEAAELWERVAGVPKDRIYWLGEKDNFWSMGDTGPCGPCSEIHFDQGEEVGCGPECGIGKCDCDRYLEVWNLVFMQYDQVDAETRIDLPRPSIDTGMGLERIAAVCQGVHSNFDTDLFQVLIKNTAQLAGVQYGDEDETDTALRVIADHSRAITFMIADAILPSNEGRGYVLRRLIRRAYRFGRLIGFKEPFLCKTVLDVIAEMGDAYPEIVKGQDFLTRVVREEEERFSVTLDKGLDILSEEIAALEERNETVISGDAAFKLYDTYGFPLDIVNDVAGKRGITVDEARYTECMNEQKARAKKAWKGSGENDPAALFAPLLESGLVSQFVGYDCLQAQSRVTALINEQGLSVDTLQEGESGFAVFAVTPFYGESGGQLGDKGTATTPTGEAEVLDTIKPGTSLTAHKVTVSKGTISLDQEATLTADEKIRLATARNHTATHLLHAALRETLGDHVKQAGSLVGPDRLRFDFTHIAPLTDDELRNIEYLVNQAIFADNVVKRDIMSFDEAKTLGAMALFGEKYGNEVTVVEVPGVSVELCGGTHLTSTGQTGLFLVLSETGVAAGVRRIEAATGFNALSQAQSLREEMNGTLGVLKARPGELVERVSGLLGQIKSLTREKEALSAKLASGAGRSLMDSVEDIAGIKVLAASLDASAGAKVLRETMDDIRSKLPSGIACLAAPQEDGKIMLLLYVSKDLHDRFTAPKLIKPVAAKVKGGGGGRPDLAQAGGSFPEGIDEAFATLRELVSNT